MRNTETGEEFEVNMPYKELDNYFTENPSVKQVFNKFPATGDSVRLGLRKHDEGFKEVLQKAKSAHKYSTVNV